MLARTREANHRQELALAKLTSEIRIKNAQMRSTASQLGAKLDRLIQRSEEEARKPIISKYQSWIWRTASYR
jgi:hypothetical protein